MNLKNILSERSQSRRTTYCRIPFIGNREIDESGLVVAKVWVRGDWGVTAKVGVSFAVMKMFWS